MAQWTLAAGFADACSEKAAAKSAPAGKNLSAQNKIRVNPRLKKPWQFVSLFLRD